MSHFVEFAVLHIAEKNSSLYNTIYIIIANPSGTDRYAIKIIQNKDLGVASQTLVTANVYPSFYATGAMQKFWKQNEGLKKNSCLQLQYWRQVIHFKWFLTLRFDFWDKKFLKVDSDSWLAESEDEDEDEDELTPHLVKNVSKNHSCWTANTFWRPFGQKTDGKLVPRSYRFQRLG